MLSKSAPFNIACNSSNSFCLSSGPYHVSQHVEFSDVDWHSLWHPVWQLVWHDSWQFTWHPVWQTPSQNVWQLLSHTNWQFVWQYEKHVWPCFTQPVSQSTRQDVWHTFRHHFPSSADAWHAPSHWDWQDNVHPVCVAFWQFDWHTLAHPGLVFCA